MTEGEGDDEKLEIQKIKYIKKKKNKKYKNKENIQKKKNFLGEVKKISHNYLSAIIC